MNQNKNKHVPVLLNEVLACLDPQPGETYLDVTAGYGGHAVAVIERTGNPKGAVLIDRDQFAVDELQNIFHDSGVMIIHNDYASASQELVQKQQSFDLILADLGVSSLHLNEASRGFSIANDGPLDMRMDQRQALQASDIVNHASEAELVNLLKNNGQEPKARQIAHLIVLNRPFTSTQTLAATVSRAYKTRQRVHPATRTFQALRIAVNDELQLLADSLPLWLQLLKPSGRIAIISFHSLEDKLVKQTFAEASGDGYDAELQLLNKQPITPNSNELVFNPRARSAKLRAAAKINNIKKGSTHAYTGKKQLPNL